MNKRESTQNCKDVSRGVLDLTCAVSARQVYTCLKHENVARITCSTVMRYTAKYALTQICSEETITVS